MREWVHNPLSPQNLLDRNGQRTDKKLQINDLWLFFIARKSCFQAMQRNAFSQFVTQYRLNTACELFQFQNMDALKSKLPIFEH